MISAKCAEFINPAWDPFLFSMTQELGFIFAARAGAVISQLNFWSAQPGISVSRTDFWLPVNSRSFSSRACVRSGQLQSSVPAAMHQ
jgi:hypothetical protein